jgi:hypothetical protein
MNEKEAIMPGRRWKRFRSGDWNEELGLLLVKAVAAVAPVPRQEDFGLDGIATLIRDDDKGEYLIAENSFYVLFKSDTDPSVKYEEHGVRWLEDLRLPFFIGHVNKEKSAISLYATHRLSQILLEAKYKEIRLYFNSVDEGNCEPEKRKAYIGPPLMVWDTLDVARKDFASWAYSILKPYVDAEQRNVTFREIRYCEPIRWESNRPPECGKGYMLAQSTVSDDDLLKAFNMMTPSLHAMAARALSNRDRQALEIVVRLIGYMRGHGFDPDPRNIHTNFYEHWDEVVSHRSH